MLVVWEEVIFIGERVFCSFVKGVFFIVGIWDECWMVLNIVFVFIMLCGIFFIFCRIFMFLLFNVSELFLIVRFSFIFFRLFFKVCSVFFVFRSFLFSVLMELAILVILWYIWYWGWLRYSLILGRYVLFFRRVCAIWKLLKIKDWLS